MPFNVNEMNENLMARCYGSHWWSSLDTQTTTNNRCVCVLVFMFGQSNTMLTRVWWSRPSQQCTRICLIPSIQYFGTGEGNRSAAHPSSAVPITKRPSSLPSLSVLHIVSLGHIVSRGPRESPNTNYTTKYQFKCTKQLILFFVLFEIRRRKMSNERTKNKKTMQLHSTTACM